MALPRNLSSRTPLVLAASVLLAGCGGGSSKQPAAPGPTGTVAAVATPQEVLVTVGPKLATKTKSVVAEQEVDLRFDSRVTKHTTVKVYAGTELIGKTGLTPTDGTNIHLLIPHLPPGELTVKDGSERTSIKVTPGGS